jgi:hypothetical protein
MAQGVEYLPSICKALVKIPNNPLHTHQRQENKRDRERERERRSNVGKQKFQFTTSF